MQTAPGGRLASSPFSLQGRGYDSSLFYFHHSSYAFAQTESDLSCTNVTSELLHDLWTHNATNPGKGQERIGRQW